MCWVIGGVVLLLFFVYAASVKVNCALCGNKLKRAKYEAMVDGKKITICPNCNRSLEAKNSRAAMQALSGRSRSIPAVDPDEAFHRLLDRVATAKGSATRASLVDRSKGMALTNQQRLQLLLEVSKAETEATLEKVDVLKSKAAKRRRLEETLTMLRADPVPDAMQADQISLLEEALATLDAEEGRAEVEKALEEK